MIAKGEIEDVKQTPESEGKNPAAVALGRMGGKARANRLTSRERSEIAKRGASERGRKRPR